MEITHKIDNLFSLNKEDFTPEQWDRMKKRDASERQAIERLTNIYGKKAADIIVANVVVSFYNVYRVWADTYDLACDGLGYAEVADIITRAVNGEPARGVVHKKQTGVPMWKN
ncbi:TPA: hypothetical protein U0510_000544 [Streptococcus suis]|nr:hypothetical protein [Streptococcus suis]HEM2671319.1 hypothetical protein [Streptococcus suis]HEM5233642.1 hypothetical protein [Streptococcus suis]